MAPNPLTPIPEESLLPKYPVNIVVHHEQSNNCDDPISDRPGCVFVYDRPVVKGNFHDDSFFRDAQKNYEQAVDNFLRSHNYNSSSSTNMSLYKDLRDKNMQQQEPQAYGLTELENKYQIVVDVKGYGAGDIAVKAVGDKELVVEGKRTETSQDGKSSTSSFSRRFELPGLVRLDAITSALSKDGVLTVSAPKLNQQQNQAIKSNSSNQQQSNSSFHNNFFDERQRMCDNQLSSMLSDLDMDSKNRYQSGFKNDAQKSVVPQVQQRPNEISPEMIEEADHYKISLDITGYSPNDISVKAVGDRELLVEGKHVEKSQAGSESVKSFNRRFCLPGLVRLEAVTSSLSLDGKLTIRAPKKQEAIQQQQQNQLNQSHIHGVPVNNNSVQQNFTTRTYKTENAMAPQQDAFGDFFNDDFGMGSMMPRRNPSSFMDKARNEYEENMRNMRNRHFAMEPSQPDGFFSDFPVMRSGVQNEPSNIVESDNDFKVKLDVSKYQPKDISVKAVGDRELLIEGKQVVREAGGPEINQSFSRKFSLPGMVKLDGIKSSLSPDGTLTITAPKAN